ncbi:unnamed protein product [Dovyalis caffra]|uniref:Uncharacterized protein n=1 Tax=Dovyalis caffra TaxID=77055 RepID=A0AAV1SLY5_9ROSI|nr:unnamed protein product [Dovyalis caffra]
MVFLRKILEHFSSTLHGASLSSSPQGTRIMNLATAAYVSGLSSDMISCLREVLGFHAYVLSAWFFIMRMQEDQYVLCMWKASHSLIWNSTVDVMFDENTSLDWSEKRVQQEIPMPIGISSDESQEPTLISSPVGSSTTSTSSSTSATLSVNSSSTTLEESSNDTPPRK